MLYVKTPEEVLALIETEFDNISQTVTVPTSNSMVLYNKSGQDNEAYNFRNPQG